MGTTAAVRRGRVGHLLDIRVGHHVPTVVHNLRKDFMADPAVELAGLRLVGPLDELEQSGAGDDGDVATPYPHAAYGGIRRGNGPPLVVIELSDVMTIRPGARVSG